MYGLKNIEKFTVLTLKEQVAYQPGQVVSKTLAQNDALSVTLFAFDKGEEISTHESGGDAFVTCLDGTGRITIDGKEARTFASQGQQRSAVLSLKLAQLELAGAESGEAPILMLDDVMSELDPSRRRQLIERIDRVQTFVTCTDLSDLAGARQGAVYRVENGVLTRE